MPKVRTAVECHSLTLPVSMAMVGRGTSSACHHRDIIATDTDSPPVVVSESNADTGELQDHYA